MPLTIDPSTQDVTLGQSVKFRVQPASGQAPAKPLELSWSVFPPEAGTVTREGVFTASSKRPSTNKAVVRATHSATGEFVEAQVELLLPWKAEWPYFIDEGEGWQGAMGEWAARVLYDVLTTLPPELVRAIGPIPIMHVAELPGEGARVDVNLHHLSADVLEIPTRSLTDPSAGYLNQFPPAPERYIALGDVFTHELAHVVMAKRCGGHWNHVVDVVEFFTGLIASVAVQAVEVATAFLAAPLLPFELLFGLAWGAADEVGSRDFMSEYCDATGWVMHNWSALRVPLLGVFLPFVLDQSPNWNMARDWGEWSGLRNKTLKTPFLMLKQLQASADPTVKRELDEAGLPTMYAASSPHEDFAEAVLHAIAGAVVNGDYRVRHKLDPVGTLGENRRQFLVDKGLLPSGWNPATAKLYALENLEVSPGSGTWWRVDRRPSPANAQAGMHIASEWSSQREKVASLFQSLDQWQDGPGRLLVRNQEILAALFPEPVLPTTVELARAAELHGDGLRSYVETEETPHPTQPGDLLLSRDAQVWMVTEVGPDGRVRQAAGRMGLPRGTLASDLVTPKSSLAYHWVPSTEPRVFAEREQASPAYEDVNGALRGAVGLWGLTRTSEGRDLETVAGFLGELLALGALVAEDPAPGPEAPLAQALAYLDTHGEGLRPYLPASTRVRVGDVLVPYHRNTLALVTRVDGAGRPVDVLMGGTYEEGLLGEPAGAVKPCHGVQPSDFHFIWVPSARSRTWVSSEERMSTVFSDLNDSLNHLCRHAGLSEIRRGEKPYVVSKLTPYQVFLGLMVERGVSPEARTRLEPLGWQAPGHAFRNHIHTHAGLRGRSRVKLGDFFSWRTTGGQERHGVALEVGAAGEPVRTFTVADSGVLAISEGVIALESLLEVYTLSLDARPLAEEAPAREFYGTPSTLDELAARRDPGVLWEDAVVDGEKLRLFYNNPQDLAKLLSARAPQWVRARLFPRSKLEGIRAAVATLGDGVVPYVPGTPLPLGTWLFVGAGGFGVVVSRHEDGTPGAMLALGTNGLGFLPVEAAKVEAYWKPSAAPRRYTAESQEEAYTDLNGELGRLRLWAYAVSDKSLYDNPFFKHAASFGEPRMRPELAALLKEGPGDTNDWIAFLMDFGQGLQPGGSPRPGDFLFLHGGARGVALDGGEMVWWESQKVRLGPVRNVKFVWRPTAKKRADVAAA